MTPIVVWKMKAPEKKPLVRREAPEEVHLFVDSECCMCFICVLQVRAKVRRGSQKRQSNPMKVLSEFHGPEDESGDGDNL